MKVSIITATYNRVSTIGHTIESVKAQDYPNIEHVIVDGGSTDGSCGLIEKKKLANSIYVSAKDNGIYDAWNKGLELATGDVIGFLNSDDFFTDTDIISTVVNTLQSSQKDCVFGDIQYVSPEELDKVSRYYSSRAFHPRRLASGYMPAHPSFYARRDVYDTVGKFKLDYNISADFEHMVRAFHTKKVSYEYIPRPFVNMRTGGISTASFKNRMAMIQDNLRACRENELKTSFARIFINRLLKLLEFR